MSEIDIKWPMEIEQYERKIYDLQQIIEISKGLSSTLDYNTLIESILLTCMGQMQLLMAAMFLRKGIGYDNFTLHRNYKGFDIDHGIEYELLSVSETVKFLESGFKCFTMAELEKNGCHDQSYRILKHLNPGLIVPLFSKGELNGIMVLGNRINRSDFAESEKEYILHIASLAGIAIHNARLYEMATTDMMTKLKIHHYFHTILAEEFKRAIKNDRPLSLIMADIDYFKSFNDLYGHIAGDKVLTSIAQAFKDNIRPMDIAARYGGEEFAVILPKTEITEALIAAERIRESVSGRKVDVDGRELSVTISIGLSQLDPLSDKHKNDLINRADRALYNSKRHGRNRVSFL